MGRRRCSRFAKGSHPIAAVPQQPKIYHIVHIDRLASIVANGHLQCDALMMKGTTAGTTIGMTDIKLRRLRLPVDCHAGLRVGDCVPFYFCPRSVMLYLLHRGNHPNLTYSGGQAPIVHLEGDLCATVDWAMQNDRRWAFTLSNAGAVYCESRCNLQQLGEINWDAVQANKWSGPGISGLVKEGKQAEFLLEHSFPWHLVERIGVLGKGAAQQVANAIREAAHRPGVEITQDWYY
jgi:ssDNA thymidine ADP-ribosyltransferase, DarT